MQICDSCGFDHGKVTEKNGRKLSGERNIEGG
jgi:hypothetical protein